MGLYIYKQKKFTAVLFILFQLTLNAQIITTIAGTGDAGYSGDSGMAVSAELYYPYAITSDANGNFYFADWFNHCVRKINTNGIITTIAGTGVVGFSGDSALATLAQLNLPTGVCVDAAGNIYISDYGNKRLRKIDTNGIISTIAGTGSSGFSGDGGPATLAMLFSAINLAVDATGNIYIADMNNDRIRKIDPSGIISTVAGNGTAGYSGDGGPAIAAQLRGPQGVTIDKAGNLYIGDSYNHCVRKVSTSGIITTIAGTGTHGYNGDGGPAIYAQLYLPSDVNVDTSGNIYISDELNCCIRKINTNNIITTIAGNGKWGISADSGEAVNTTFYYPKGMEYRDGRIYISDTQSNRIRMFIENNPVLTINEFETGIQELKIYPNPATTEIYIDLPATKEFDVEIYNTPGDLVLSKKNCSNLNPINISVLNKGLYHCKIKTPRHQYSGKLVKSE